MKTWIACYDVGTKRARQRRKLATILLGYGSRVQMSVYELMLTGPEVEELVQEVSALLKLDEDRFALYPLPDQQKARVQYLGPMEPYELPPVLVL
jgi:CRISPR-associated protein Cas2